MNICKIFDGDYPWDVRVEKVILSLITHGHEVHLVCRNIGMRSSYECSGRLHIHRLRSSRNRALNGFLSFPAFFNPKWISRIFQVVRDCDVELIIVRDLPLALTAILAARRYGVPVMLDMAENYPEMLKHLWKFGRFNPLNIIVRNPWIARAVERIAVKQFDHVLVVAEESRQRLLKLGVGQDRISVLPNTPRITDLCWVGNAQADDDEHFQGGSFRMIYVGGLGPGRGLDQVISAIPAIVKRIPGLRLVIIGSRGGEFRKLKSLVERLGVADHVMFKGWVEPKEVPGYINVSDVGVIPHRVSGHTLTTIPNKLFDYMALGKPVIAADVAPIRRIVEQEQCGLIYSNERELSNVTVNLFLDVSERERMGANGKGAVLRKYNWEAHEKTLIDLVQKQRTPW